jgi:hypothetical protein
MIVDNNEYKTKTICGYKKTRVKNRLEKSIMNSNLEEAQYWCVEMICSNLYLDLWDTIITSYSKHIHLQNVKMPIVIMEYFKQFRRIANKSALTDLKNNKTIRRIFSRLITLQVLSPKKHPLKKVSIPKEDYEIVNLSKRLKATERFIDVIWKKNDPDILLIPGNELMSALREKRSKDACYWVEWILGYEREMKAKKHPISLEERNITGIDVKHRRYLIWLVWEIFYNISKGLKGKEQLLIERIVHTCQSLFTIRFSRGEISKRRYLIYFVISLLTETYEYRSLNEYDERISHIESKLDKIYNLKEKEIIKEKLTDNDPNNKAESIAEKKQEDTITLESYDLLLLGGN